MAEHQDHAQAERAERLDAILRRLTKEGMTQRSVAAELNVPPNYLSDLRHGRRVITDQFCRTFAQVFQVRCAWLADGEGPESVPQLTTPPSSQGNLLLPVLQQPHVGDPEQCPSWDGSRVEVAGAAAAAAARAITPYLLRLSQTDGRNRLQPGDLLLVSQENDAQHEIAIARHRGTFVVVRQDSDGQRLSLANDKPLSGKIEIVGQCLGLVWAKL